MVLSIRGERGAFVSGCTSRLSKSARCRRRRPTVESLEGRSLLSTSTVNLISENDWGPTGATLGASLASVAADGQYVAFEGVSYTGSTTPAPSDLVAGLTVQNNATNIYVRDTATNKTTCISLDLNGNLTGNDNSIDPVISANGETVVFLSNATDLTANDNLANNSGNRVNVFAWSRATNTLSLVTVNYENTAPANDPNPGEDGTAADISVSADGRFVSYESAATDLVSGVTDNNYTTNVYVRDLQTNTTILVSRDVAGTNIGDAPSSNPVISSDGSTVVFDSFANNLDPNNNGVGSFSNQQVYVSTLDASTDTLTATQLVSVDPTGEVAGNGGSGFPSLSDNGQVVAFQSSATNLVSLHVQGGTIEDVYVRNLATGTTQLVSVDQAGTADGAASSFTPQLSGDGNHVLFYSLAGNLVANENASTGNVFERDLTTNTTQLVSVNDTGTNSADATSVLANQAFTNAPQQAIGQISDNGQYVIFCSTAKDLVPNFSQKNGGTFDLYRRDTVAGTTTLLSRAVASASTGGSGISGAAVITPDGVNVFFQSAFGRATDNLVSNDTHADIQVFEAKVSSAAAVTTEPATAITASGATLNGSVNPEGSATTVTFVYGTNSSLSSGTTTTSTKSIGAGTTAVSVSQALTGLTDGTTYYFEVTATNGLGTTTGSIQSFVATTASTPPVAATEAATAITTSGATFNASVNPDGSATTVTFVYGTTPSLSSGTTTTSTQSIGAGEDGGGRVGGPDRFDVRDDLLLRGQGDKRGRYDDRVDPQLRDDGDHFAAGRDDAGGHGDHDHRGHPSCQREPRRECDDGHVRVRHDPEPDQRNDGHAVDRRGHNNGGRVGEPDRFDVRDDLLLRGQGDEHRRYVDRIDPQLRDDSNLNAAGRDDEGARRSPRPRQLFWPS